MQTEEIREMTDEDIRTRMAELDEERFRLRIRGGTQPLEDPLRIRAIRRTIARLQTVLRERQLTTTGGER